MDPNAAWHALVFAFLEEDAEACREKIEALRFWLARSGFPPTLSGSAALDKVMVLAACEHILALDFMKGDSPA